jgi:chaperone modulatory protein CbpM
MTKQTTDILTGDIVENETRLSLQQLCDTCSVETEYIITLVNQGCIEPVGVEQSHWRFSGISIRRVQKAKRLQQDLGINPAGVALVIDLIEEIERLRCKLERM